MKAANVLLSACEKMVLLDAILVLSSHCVSGRLPETHRGPLGCHAGSGLSLQVQEWFALCEL